MQLEAPQRLCLNCLCYYNFSQRLLSYSATQRSSASYYKVLGVKPDASLDEIKNAFFDKSKKFHPDSDPTNPSLHSQFIKLNEAYRVLSKDATRKEYDLQMRYQSFTASSRSTHNPRTAGTTQDNRYWEQFRNTQNYSEEVWKKKRKKNLKTVGYCIIAMLLSICAHYFGFRKLEELHNDFMDKKDKVITKIYNESKERARLNGLKKQQEILRQTHAEFLKRYKIRQSGKEK